MDNVRHEELAKQVVWLSKEDLDYIHKKFHGPDNSLKREEMKQGMRIVRAIRLGYEEREAEDALAEAQEQEWMSDPALDPNQ